MFTIKLNGEEKTFEKKVRVLDLIQPAIIVLSPAKLTIGCGS